MGGAKEKNEIIYLILKPCFNFLVVEPSLTLITKPAIVISRKSDKQTLPKEEYNEKLVLFIGLGDLCFL